MLTLITRPLLCARSVAITSRTQRSRHAVIYSATSAWTTGSATACANARPAPEHSTRWTSCLCTIKWARENASLQPKPTPFKHSCHDTSLFTLIAFIEHCTIRYCLFLMAWLGLGEPIRQGWRVDVELVTTNVDASFFFSGLDGGYVWKLVRVLLFARRA